MEQFRDFLITDRTAADVERARYLLSLWDSGSRTWRGTAAERAELEAGPKGFYNAKDLNRVAKAAGYLAGRLWIMGYNAGAAPPAVYMVSTGVQPQGAGTSAGGLFYGGEQATVRAAASAGYAFAEWQEDGETVSQSAVYNFTVSADRRLTAVFSRLSGEDAGVVGYGRIGRARIGRRVT